MKSRGYVWSLISLAAMVREEKASGDDRGYLYRLESGVVLLEGCSGGLSRC